MIRSLILSNFQSHPSTTIEFTPGINAIIGASDKGKSAVLRGFEWVRTNRPNGDAHVSDWALDSKGKQTDECRVVVTTDRHRIERVRHNKVNGYVLDGATIEATKGDLPAEITAAFGLLDLNVQKQLDGPFLLSQSGGEVARFFNSLVNLEEIDHCMSAADGLKREIMGDIRRSLEAIESTRAQEAKFSWVDEARSALKLLSDSVIERDILQRKLDLLTAALASRKRYEEHAARQQRILDLAPMLESVRGLLRERSEAQARLEALRALLERRSKALVEVQLLPKLQEALDALATYRASQREIVGVSTKLDKISLLVARRKDAERSLERTLPILALANTVETLRALHDSATTATRSLDALRGLLRARERARETLDRTAALSGISTERLASLLRMRDEKEAKLAALRGLLKRRSEYYTFIDKKRREIKELEAQLPELCPTCGQPRRSA